jgi:hypothetical protein
MAAVLLTIAGESEGRITAERWPGTIEITYLEQQQTEKIETKVRNVDRIRT